MSEVEVKKAPFNIYDYVFTLEEKIRVLEQEKQLNSMKHSQIESELNRLQKELKELREPPLIVGVIQEVMEDKLVVKNSNGIELLISLTEEFKSKVKSGLRVALNQRNLSLVEILTESTDYRARAMEIVEKPKVTFKEIGGLRKEILELEEAIILPLTHPKKFEEIGIEPPCGVLLYGEPGTGKTMLAKAVANATNSTFIGITGSELVRKYIGEGAKLVRDVFKMAKEKKHSIIFIDEIDSIGAQRLDATTGGDREVQRTLMQLLAEIDGFNEVKNVKIIAATNRIDILDPALLRAGRFDRIIEVPLPDEKARKEIFKIHSKKMKMDSNVSIDELVKLTEKANGADIKAICMESGINAIRANEKSISLNHFKEAVKKVLGEESNEDEFAEKMTH